MNTIQGLLCVLLVGGALAQDSGHAVRLPQLFRVGPMPGKAIAITLLADGSLHAADGSETSLERTVPAVESAVLVRADAETPAAAIAQLLAAAGKRGMHAVHFAATLPDGTAGAFCIAVSTETPSPRLVMRMHSERPGVPPNSVVPLLRRMVAGPGVPTYEPFVLACKVPGEARWAAVLSVLAAAAEAGVASVTLEGEEPAAAGAGLGLEVLAGDQGAKHRSLAIDLGPVPDIQVQGHAIEQSKPARQETTFGFAAPPPQAAPRNIVSGAGGRYGGRAGGAVGGGANRPVAAIALAKTWLMGQQLQDGAFASAGEQGSVEATSLVLLVLLGGGDTLDAGDDAGSVQRAVGWLLASQRPDGSFVGSGNVRQHALASYALAEATGLSTSGMLCRGATSEALAWLVKQRAKDGGFGAGGVTASNAGDTTLALTAIASASFFKLDVGTTTNELVVWFDEHPSTSAADRAAELFARFFAGQDPKRVGLMDTIAGQLQGTASVEDPWGCYWATNALFQSGGARWAAWSKKLAAVTASQLGDGDDRGSWAPADDLSRLETTALRTLSLQAHYRYSRLIR